MRYLIPLAAVFAIAPYALWAQTMPRDYYDDAQAGKVAFWKNPEPGWVVDQLGNTHSEVEFVSEGCTPQVFICKEAKISYQLYRQDTVVGTPDTLHRLDMSFVGVSALSPDPVSQQMLAPVRNFYFEHTAPDGIEGVHAYERILFQDVYPEVDLWVYSGSVGQKMMMVINPGARLTDIKLLFQGQDSMSLDVMGNLRILLEDKSIVLPQAVAYQVDANDSIVDVDWIPSYLPDNDGGTVMFEFDTYDDELPLILLFGAPPMAPWEPLQAEGLCWSSFFGGDLHDHLQCADHDKDGNFYVAGNEWGSFALYGNHVGSDIIQESDGNHAITAITRFETGTHRWEWTSFIGAGLNDPIGGYSPSDLSIKEDSEDAMVYVVGSFQGDYLYAAHEADEYTQPVPTGAQQKTWIARLKCDFGLLKWCTSFGNEGTGIIAVDHIYGDSRTYICGTTVSEIPTEDPDVDLPDAEQYAYVGDGDAFVAEFNADDQIVWSTCIGTGGNDALWNVGVHEDGVVFSGASDASGIPYGPGPTGAYHDTYSLSRDVFLVEFNTAGELTWSTYLGGNSLDDCNFDAMEVTAAKDIYLTGCTYSTDLDYVPGPGWYDVSHSDLDGFIARFSGVDRDLIWFTNLDGGTSYAATGPCSICALEDGSICVGGYTGYVPFPIQPCGSVYYQPAIYPNLNGNNDPFPWDCFLLRFGPNNELLHGTYFGGDGGTEAENMIALSGYGMSAYAVGGVGQLDADPTYFPLFDPGDPAWYEYVHYPSLSDGFITAFCYEDAAVGSPSPIAGGALRAWVDEFGTCHVAGLSDGTYPLRVMDALGRLVLERAVRVNNGQGSLNMETLSPGTYALQVAERTSIKFVRQP